MPEISVGLILQAFHLFAVVPGAEAFVVADHVLDVNVVTAAQPLGELQ